MRANFEVNLRETTCIWSWTYINRGLWIASTQVQAFIYQGTSENPPNIYVFYMES